MAALFALGNCFLIHCLSVTNLFLLDVAVWSYNCGELGHLSHQCNKPKKNKFKGKKEDDSDDEKKEKRFFKRKDGKQKRFHKKKNGKTYIVGDWLTDIESSSGSSSSEEENDEKVAAIAGD